jgi:hypothetical protein
MLVRRDNNRLVVHWPDARDKIPVVNMTCYSQGIGCIPE